MRIRERFGAAVFRVAVPAGVAAEHPLVRHALGSRHLDAFELLREAGKIRDDAECRSGNAGLDDVDEPRGFALLSQQLTAPRCGQLRVLEAVVDDVIGETTEGTDSR